ncbi:hypothetical protein [Paenibacillus sp. GYB003]|uniref:hypothetical protein n=1 Tax=Paenibacillus sp. GYB003 TaxID=2994392 RepID=UPI002F965972
MERIVVCLSAQKRSFFQANESGHRYPAQNGGKRPELPAIAILGFVNVFKPPQSAPITIARFVSRMSEAESGLREQGRTGIEAGRLLAVFEAYWTVRRISGRLLLSNRL